MIFVIATLTVSPENRDTLVAAAQPCIAATRNEAGCISYDLTASSTEPGTAIFVERWESRDHLQAHFGTPHMATWREASGKLITDRKVEIVHVDHVETL